MQTEPAAPSRIHTGDLTVTARNAAACADITEVGGSLYIGAEASLPALTSVGDYLYAGHHEPSRAAAFRAAIEAHEAERANTAEAA